MLHMSASLILMFLSGCLRFGNAFFSRYVDEMAKIITSAQSPTRCGELAQLFDLMLRRCGLSRLTLVVPLE